MITKDKQLFCVELHGQRGIEEILPDALYSLCTGIWIEDRGDDVIVRCYPLDRDAFLAFLQGSSLPIAEVRVEAEKERDYEALVRQYFRAFTLEGVTVVPPWVRPRPGRPFVIVDPGMAFGTGRHESTRLMVKMMGQLDMQATRVLDMGCGSAILCLFARLFGAGSVMGVDIDPDAVFSARKNLRLNQADSINLACADLTGLRGAFDVVLANLDYDTFRRHRSPVLERVAPGGFLVASGIEAEFLNPFLTLMEPLKPVLRRKMGSWHGFVFKIDRAPGVQ